jgi:signal transduction histidine kinase/ActR/RegA family two-component response regulator
MPPAATVIVSGEEFLAVPISMGTDDKGQPATLLLLQSLTRALEPMQHSFLVALVSCGALTVILAGLAAWRISRSILVPLERFVSFVRSVATTHDASQRFRESGLTAEVETLNDAFGDLLDSLQEREKLLMLHQREELIRMERLKESEKLASLGRMLSGAAHEINNPLTAVLGQVDLTLSDAGLPVKSKDRLEKARKEAHRISALVRNLLKVAHRDTGERRRMDLHQILRETLDLRKHDFNAAGISLTFEPCDKPIVLQANELELQQVFLNIINNAFDALKEMKEAKQAAGQLEVTVRTGSSAGRASVTISDNGPGMKQPGKVFDHFYTTKDIGKGTGLGLSITHAIVQNHGGTITAQNQPTGGACFVIDLPHEAAAPQERLAPVPHPLLAGPEPKNLPAPLQLETALIVEDEPTVLEYQMEILRSLGASPVGARSADEAIEWLRRREFQVIVSDMKMPGGKSGADLFAWVGKNLPAMTGRFVFVTGDTANETTQAFLEKSGRPYLMKPFGLEDYVQALRDAQTLAPVG